MKGRPGGFRGVEVGFGGFWEVAGSPEQSNVGIGGRLLERCFEGQIGLWTGQGAGSWLILAIFGQFSGQNLENRQDRQDRQDHQNRQTHQKSSKLSKMTKIAIFAIFDIFDDFLMKKREIKKFTFFSSKNRHFHEKS